MSNPYSFRIKLSFLILIFLPLSLGAQSLQDQSWKLKRKGINRASIKTEGMTSGKTKIKGSMSSSSYKHGKTVGESKSGMYVQWKTPTGVYDIDGVETKKWVEYESENISVVTIDNGEIVGLDSTENFHHFDISAKQEDNVMGNIHIRVKPSVELLTPPPVWGLAKLPSGEEFLIEREMKPSQSFGETLNPRSDWEFSMNGKVMAIYHYHYNKPKVSLDSSIKSEDKNVLLGMMGVLGLWIQSNYMAVE